MTKKKHFLPFVRQIQEYYNYSENGSIYLTLQFSIKNLNAEKLSNSYLKLLKENDLLRSVFKRTRQGLVIREILPETLESFSPKVISVSSETAIQDNLNTFLRLKRKAPLDKAPLCELLIYSHFNISLIYIIINHIICDRFSLEIIKQVLIKEYSSNPIKKEIVSFESYSSLVNEKLRNNYIKKQKQLNYLSKETLTTPSVSLTNQSSFLTDISNLDYSVNSSMNKKARLYISDFQIPGKMILNNVSWKSIFITALIIISKEIYNQKKIIGFMYRDNFNFPMKLKIGDLLAENYIEYYIDTPKMDNIIEINSLLFKSYKNGIFNYKMYGLDLNEITSSVAPCILNFSYTHDYFNNNTMQLNTFHKEYIIRCDFEPNIIIYKDGTVILKWIFDNKKISEKEMVKINNLFKSLLTNKILTLF